MKPIRRRFIMGTSMAGLLSACGAGVETPNAAPAGSASPDPASTGSADALATQVDHHGGRHHRRPPKVILDSDFNTMSDDGQALVLLAQLQAVGQVDLLGVTVVSGNKWLRQGVAEALKAVERLGVENQVPVFAGANRALNHDQAMVEAEFAAGAGGDGYRGAWGSPEPMTEADLKAPPDGFATHTRLQEQSAIDFIVDSVRANPGEITLLAIGPLTNIALAVRQCPDIVPLIRRIVYMGGAVHVPGNTTDLAEFNWWFDPEAAREVLALPVPHVVVPLDVTNTVLLDRATYDRTAFPPNPTAVTTAFRQEWFAPLFEQDPGHTSSIWDTLVVAWLIDPSFATEVSREYLEIVVNPGGVDNGRSIGHRHRWKRRDLRKVEIVRRFDNARFIEWYVDLMTRPVPVMRGPKP